MDGEGESEGGGESEGRVGEGGRGATDGRTDGRTGREKESGRAWRRVDEVWPAGAPMLTRAGRLLPRKTAGPGPGQPA